MIVKGYISDVT